jgi:hypothetical protein
LSDICALWMLGIDHCPRVLLEDEHRLWWAPEVFKEQFKWNLMSNTRKLIDLLECIINLLLILFHINLLWFFEWVEVVRELQSTYSAIHTI